jgi:VWFA-related protein
MRRIVLLLVAALPAVVLTQAPQFRSSVDLVHLDVSVLDKNRVPIRGLTRADFTILEDGQPRPVDNFVAVDVPPPPPVLPVGSWMRTVAADVQTNDIARTPEGRLIVLLLDDVMIPADPAMIAATKRIGQLALDRLSRGDRMAVVFTAASGGAQNFTSDRARLTRAIDSFKPGFATHMLGWDAATKNLEKPEPNNWEPGVDTDAGYRSGSIRTLEDVARSLAVAPERRKILIFVSTGVMADGGSAGGVVLASPGRSMMSRDANISLVKRLPGLFRLMRETNVTMYTIDPSGLGVMEQYLTRVAQSLPGLMHATSMYGAGEDWFNLPSPPRPADLARHVSSVSLDFLKTAASNTGGFAITDTNDFESGLQRLFAENASYYIVGFALPPGRKAGSLHRLEVKVKRPDVQVRTRSGYEVPEQPAPAPASATPVEAADAPPPPPTALLAAPVPKGDLPMRLVVTPLPSGTNDKRDVAVMLWMDDIPGTASQSFDVELRAFTMEGGQKLGERRTGQTAESKTGNSTFELLARIALPPGRYEIRAAARVEPANLAGSVFGDVLVPEPPKSGLALSGVLLDAVPAARAGPLDVFKGLLPLVPTSRREFLRGTAVRTMVRVYQAGAAPLVPVSLLVSIQDWNGAVIYNYPHRLAVTRFDAVLRRTDFEFEIPFQALQSGEHLLTFEARAGEHRATQQLRFNIQ